jgi:hypothetical protein
MSYLKRVFTRRTFIKSLFVSLVAGSKLAESTAATVPISIKLIGTSVSSLKFSVLSSIGGKAFIEYSYSKSGLGKKTSVISFTKNAPKIIAITSLKEDSVVYYRLRYALGSSKTFSALPIASTNTGANLNSNVFAIQADPHMDENSSAEIYNATLSQIVAASPAFLMDLGDIFMVDKLSDKSEANIRARFEIMKGYYSKLQNVPLKITLGNHDGELGYSPFNTKKYRQEYFPEQTGDVSYFQISGPDSLHIALDPFTYTTSNPNSDGWQWTLGKTQYDWLKSTLENSQAKHKFIYIHHLLVGDAQSRGGVEIAKFNEWGGKNKDGSEGFSQKRPGWSKPIHQLLLDNKVGFVFKGHDHLYVKQELDGIIYQTLPQPSHPGDKANSAIEYGYTSGKVLGGSGFLKVTTSDSEVKVDFVKYDGSIVDSYVRVSA